MIDINRLAGELSGAARTSETLKNDAAGKARKASCGMENSLLSLKVQFPDTENCKAARAEKVEALKAAIEAGNYNPDPLLVARKILGVE